MTKPDLEKSENEIALLEEKDFKQICEMTKKFKDDLTAITYGRTNKREPFRSGLGV